MEEAAGVTAVNSLLPLVSRFLGRLLYGRAWYTLPSDIVLSGQVFAPVTLGGQAYRRERWNFPLAPLPGERIDQTLPQFILRQLQGSLQFILSTIQPHDGYGPIVGGSGAAIRLLPTVEVDELGILVHSPHWSLYALHPKGNIASLYAETNQPLARNVVIKSQDSQPWDGGSSLFRLGKDGSSKIVDTDFGGNKNTAFITYAELPTGLYQMRSTNGIVLDEYVVIAEDFQEPSSGSDKDKPKQDFDAWLYTDETASCQASATQILENNGLGLLAKEQMKQLYEGKYKAIAYFVIQKGSARHYQPDKLQSITQWDSAHLAQYTLQAVTLAHNYGLNPRDLIENTYQCSLDLPEAARFQYLETAATEMVERNTSSQQLAPSAEKQAVTEEPLHKQPASSELSPETSSSPSLEKAAYHALQATVIPAPIKGEVVIHDGLVTTQSENQQGQNDEVLTFDVINTDSKTKELSPFVDESGPISTPSDTVIDAVAQLSRDFNIETKEEKKPLNTRTALSILKTLLENNKYNFLPKHLSDTYGQTVIFDATEHIDKEAVRAAIQSGSMVLMIKPHNSGSDASGRHNTSPNRGQCHTNYAGEPVGHCPSTPIQNCVITGVAPKVMIYPTGENKIAWVTTVAPVAGCQSPIWDARYEYADGIYDKKPPVSRNIKQCQGNEVSQTHPSSPCAYPSTGGSTGIIDWRAKELPVYDSVSRSIIYVPNPYYMSTQYFMGAGNRAPMTEMTGKETHPWPHLSRGLTLPDFDPNRCWEMLVNGLGFNSRYEDGGFFYRIDNPNQHKNMPHFMMYNSCTGLAEVFVLNDKKEGHNYEKICLSVEYGNYPQEGYLPLNTQQCVPFQLSDDIDWAVAVLPVNYAPEQAGTAFIMLTFTDQTTAEIRLRGVGMTVSQNILDFDSTKNEFVMVSTRDVTQAHEDGIDVLFDLVKTLKAQGKTSTEITGFLSGKSSGKSGLSVAEGMMLAGDVVSNVPVIGPLIGIPAFVGGAALYGVEAAQSGEQEYRLKSHLKVPPPMARASKSGAFAGWLMKSEGLQQK